MLSEWYSVSYNGSDKFCHSWVPFSFVNFLIIVFDIIKRNWVRQGNMGIWGLTNYVSCTCVLNVSFLGILINWPIIRDRLVSCGVHKQGKDYGF